MYVDRCGEGSKTFEVFASGRTNAANEKERTDNAMKGFTAVRTMMRYSVGDGSDGKGLGKG